MTQHQTPHYFLLAIIHMIIYDIYIYIYIYICAQGRDPDPGRDPGREPGQWNETLASRYWTL